MTATDLWPDFKIDPKPRGIRQILEEAGQGLKAKTNGLVEFRVWPVESRSGPYPLRLRCELYVAKLDYAYFLMEVDTAATGFPVELRTGSVPVGGVLVADDETALLTALARIFQSEHTRDVIQNLISMATE
jgi:hypothetical protein